MNLRYPGSFFEANEWFEWVYPNANPFIDVAAIPRNFHTKHLILDELQVYPSYGSQSQVPVRRLLIYRQEFLNDLHAMGGYTLVTLNGTRVKSGRPPRPFSLTLPCP
ncbi:hypothetical protein [Dyella sp. ASV21]|uniref:hypothetical protein n=1 Tax=Dyella sp. ASV21 TaxID=2795114 RepID=UPI0018EBA52C|nr:hypothetical protein [Dyella sp. ASV21]